MTKTNQSLLFSRYFKVENSGFIWNILFQTSWTDRQSATNIYNTIKVGMIKLNVSTYNLCAVTADGTAVMKSERKDVLNLLNKDSENQIFRVEDVKLTVRKLLNSKQWNMFRSICEINDEKPNGSPTYNHVRSSSYYSSVQQRRGLRLCFIWFPRKP